MNLKKSFEIAAASVTGRDHRIASKNNQDAFCCLASDELIVAVVCDGCGSGSHSDLGAKLGVRLVARNIYNRYRNHVKYKNYGLSVGAWQENLKGVFENVLIQLTSFARDYADIRPRPDSAPWWWDCVYDWKGCVHDCFLFTIVGFIMTPFDSLIFSIGDGIFALNGRTKVLGPFPNNAPPYIGYNAIKEDILLEADYSKFAINAFLPTDEVEAILIGTDGVVDFVQTAEKNLPGKEELVGSLSQFWENDLYFRNPDALRRRFAIVNADVTKPLWEERRLMKYPGLLRDDTTLVVVRRKKS